MPDLLQVVTVKPRIEDLWGIPVIGIRQPVIDGFDAVIKRMVDINWLGVRLTGSRASDDCYRHLD
ncbi:MAG: hypothetical protein HC893_04210 [Chloroflexaceae bacterium]|nr:hypothetical protein [Chloroflexaceae bacterium]